MEVFPLRVSTVGRALKEYPDLTVSISKPNLFGQLASLGANDLYSGGGFLPPGFRQTMGKPDDRLPEFTSGIGVIIENIQKFYPFDALLEKTVDVINGRRLIISYPPDGGFPFATWEDGEVPLQLLSRWYGFSYTYPGCEIYDSSSPL